MPDAASKALTFAIRIVIYVPVFELEKKFWFDEHFEGARIYDDTLYIQINERADPPTVRYGRESVEGSGNPKRRAKVEKVGDAVEVRIPVGFPPDRAERRKPHPGFSGALLLRASPWNR
jgi:hypothetical protein